MPRRTADPGQMAERGPEAEGEDSEMGDVARKRKSESEMKQRKQEA